MTVVSAQFRILFAQMTLAWKSRVRSNGMEARLLGAPVLLPGGLGGAAQVQSLLCSPRKTPLISEIVFSQGNKGLIEQ
jgi:hypothetical protein